MPEAVEMLREDHEKVKGLFEEFEKAEEDDEKLRIVRTTLTELKIHAALEEEIFYPAVRELIDDDDQMDEALEEHRPTTATPESDDSRRQPKERPSIVPPLPPLNKPVTQE